MWTIVKDAMELLNTTFSTTYGNKEHFEENKKNLPLVLGFWLLVNWTNEFQNFKQRLQTKSGQINIASLERRGWLLKQKGTKLRAVEAMHYDCHIKEKNERWNSLMRV